MKCQECGNSAIASFKITRAMQQGLGEDPEDLCGFCLENRSIDSDALACLNYTGDSITITLLRDN